MDEIVLEARDASFRYQGATVDAVNGVSVDVRRGELFGIVGPNGSGKTTFLRLLLGVLVPGSGSVAAFGRPAIQWTRREMAKRIGVVVQREEPAFPIRVAEAVGLGRYPHLGLVGAESAHDREVVNRALERADIAGLRDRWVGTLSGGEWQRVRVARALAQEPQVLVLDEATANLDLRHEMEVFELLAVLVREKGLTGVVVTHHLNLAARFVDRLLVMDAGRAAGIGKPEDIITAELLGRVFGWPVDVLMWKGQPQFVPLKGNESREKKMQNNE